MTIKSCHMASGVLQIYSENGVRVIKKKGGPDEILWSCEIFQNEITKNVSRLFVTTSFEA
jgi:hypothetical protein